MRGRQTVALAVHSAVQALTTGLLTSRVRCLRRAGASRRLVHWGTRTGAASANPLLVAARAGIVMTSAIASFLAATDLGFDQDTLDEFTRRTLRTPFGVAFWGGSRVFFLVSLPAWVRRLPVRSWLRGVRLLAGVCVRSLGGFFYVVDELTYAIAVCTIPIAYGVASVLGHLGLIVLPKNVPITQLWVLPLPLCSALLVGYPLAKWLYRRYAARLRSPQWDDL